MGSPDGAGSADAALGDGPKGAAGQTDVRPGSESGAAYLPVLAKQLQVPNNRYLSITPTKDFQVFHYSQREWVPYVLAECSDKSKAFDNWMERDALFAKAVQKQCADAGYASIVHHGEIPVDEMIARVAAHFELD